MPIPKPPEPFRTWLGRYMGSEESADLERRLIRKRQDYEAGRFQRLEEKYERDLQPVLEAQTHVPQCHNAQKPVANGAVSAVQVQKQGQVPPPAAEKLYDWLIGHGFRVYLKDGKLFVGPGPLSKTLRGAVNQHLKGLRLLLTKGEA